MREPLTNGDHVVVVGAGIAGWRFAEGLRREGYSGDVTLIGAEVHPPYDRPPLSKQVLTGKWEPAKANLASDDRLSELNIATRLGDVAVSLDVANTSVSLSSGEVVEGSVVVVATGLRARQLDVTASDGVVVLRTLEDVARLRRIALDARSQSRPVIIGGGFIGAEVATSLVTLGLEPVVLEALPRPLQGILGEEASTWLEGLAAKAGVELRCNQSVRDVRAAPVGFEVDINDQDSITAPFVVAAVGAVPNVEWLESSGLQLSNGVVVDENLSGDEGVYAIGDVTRFRWRHGHFDEVVRIEHWQNASDLASALATSLARGEPVDLAGLVPYFWSDQYGTRIQLLGHPNVDDDVEIVDGSPSEDRWLALYSRGGIVTGGLALKSPRALMLCRGIIAEQADVVEARSSRPWVT